MSGGELEVSVLHDTAHLVSGADEWDDLLRRSHSCLPTLRGATMRQWLGQFAHDARVGIVMVLERGRLIAALPLVERWNGRYGAIGALPDNHWSALGDLLSYPQCSRAGCAVAQGLELLPWPAVSPTAVRGNDPSWRLCRQAVAGLGCPVAYGMLDRVGVVRVDGDWNSYLASRRTRNHRKHLGKLTRRATKEGAVRLVAASPHPDEFRSPIERGFGIEDLSWEGRATRTSVVSHLG